jgi:acetolactate synthase-1/2/3 large subunit
MLLALRRAGESPLFTLNGGHIWPLLTAAQEYGTPIIDVRHEQTAAFAAEGWAKVTRQCGVAAVTAGPGVTNSVSALAQARSNDSPILLLGGRAPASRWGMGSLQEMDHVAVVKSLCKSARTLDSPDQAYRETSESLRLALSGRTGPAFIDVPIDVLFAAADVPEAQERLVPDPGPPPDPDAIVEVARFLGAARRPALLAGGAIWWAHAEAELVQLTEAAQVPVVANGLARGMLPPAHPLAATRGRATALGEADLVLVVGVPLDFRLNYGRAPVISSEARIVYIDVDDFRKHRAPAAAIYGDLRRALAQLAEAVRPGPEREPWLGTVAAATAATREGDRAVAASDSVPIHPARLVAEVDGACDPDAILVGDGGDFVSFAGRGIERPGPGQWLDGGPFGCLGAGPGYALAAKLAHPDRQVVMLSGDGAFGFSAMDFDTLARHRVPVVCVIGNNGIWATEKHPMERLLGASIAADLRPGTRYDQVVSALGCHGELVERPDQIRPALDRAFRAGVPACVNVICDPEAVYPRSSVLM